MGTPAGFGLISLREAADRLGMSPAQLRNLARQGKLPASKHAGRWLVEAAALGALAPPSRQRARQAEGVALADMEHGLRGRGAVVSEPRRGQASSRARAAESEAIDQQLGIGSGADLATSAVRQAQRRNLEALADRLDKPHAPERSI